jgi:hypothetical protein
MDDQGISRSTEHLSGSVLSIAALRTTPKDRLVACPGVQEQLIEMAEIGYQGGCARRVGGLEGRICRTLVT